MDNFDLKALEDEAQAAKERKGWLNFAGDALNSISATPTAYELLKGRTSGSGTMGNLVKTAAESIGDPRAQAEKSMALAKMAYDNQKQKREQGDMEKDSDPSSPASISARAWAKANGLTVSDKDSAYDLERQFGIKNLIGKKFSDHADFQRQVQIANLNHKNAKELAMLKLDGQAKKKNDPNRKLANLNASDKARFDNALMVLKSIDKMGKALDSGDNTFSLAGDNDYTAAERTGTEAYGRMQSGGAINKDEEARFQKTLPRALDGKRIQREKLLNQRAEMISRLKTLGFTPEEIGYTPENFAYGSDSSDKAHANVAHSAERAIVKKLYSPSRNKTRITYSDGTIEEKDGKHR